MRVHGRTAPWLLRCLPTRPPARRRTSLAFCPARPPALIPPCPALQVGVLVNNAGLSYDHPEYLDEVDAGFISDIMTINALVPAMVRGRAALRACVLEL